MRKRVLGVSILLSCLFWLPACAVRMTGPCLGFGCPALGGVLHASNAAPNSKGATVTAKNAPSQNTAPKPGK
jgi:hypothetical protein